MQIDKSRTSLETWVYEHVPLQALYLAVIPHLPLGSHEGNAIIRHHCREAVEEDPDDNHREADGQSVRRNIAVWHNAL